MYITYLVLLLTTRLGGSSSLDIVNVKMSPNFTEILLVLCTYSRTCLFFYC